MLEGTGRPDRRTLCRSHRFLSHRGTAPTNSERQSTMKRKFSCPSALFDLAGNNTRHCLPRRPPRGTCHHMHCVAHAEWCEKGCCRNPRDQHSRRPTDDRCRRKPHSAQLTKSGVSVVQRAGGTTKTGGNRTKEKSRQALTRSGLRTKAKYPSEKKYCLLKVILATTVTLRGAFSRRPVLSISFTMPIPVTFLPSYATATNLYLI